MAKTVILIGNGFDKALGYKTGYGDFIKSSYFQKISTSHLCKKIIEKKTIQKWVDVEEELFEYAKNISNINAKDTWRFFKSEYDSLSGALFNYLKYEVPETISTPNSSIMQLVKTWNIDEQNRHGDKLSKVDVLCFNYTSYCLDTFSEWCNVKYVHGSLDNKSIILGVDDIYHTELEPELSFIIKSGFNDINISGVSDILESAERFIIFGCSLGKTDFWYYNKIFNDKKNKSFEIYYHGDSEAELMKRRIRDYAGNLSDFKSYNELKLYNSANLANERLSI